MHLGIDKNGQELNEGDRVTHPRFGAGEVIRGRDGLISVRTDVVPAPGAEVSHARAAELEKILP
jgi:hypothetical protein